MPECPVCDADVSLTDDTVVGELIECPDCGTELEVDRAGPGGGQRRPPDGGGLGRMRIRDALAGKGTRIG